MFLDHLDTEKSSQNGIWTGENASAFAGKKVKFSYLKSIKIPRNSFLDSPSFFNDVFWPPGHEKPS